jgi:hypothetical protein
MSVRRHAPAALLLSGSFVLAADADVPDAGFLEYLGMWDSSDEEWLIFDAEPVAMDDAVESTAEGTTGHDERIDPAPRGEESTERDDEG